MMTTVLDPDEILTEIRVPVLEGQRTVYFKNAPRPSDFAIVGIAVCLKLNRQGVCEDVAVGVTGITDKAYRATDVEEVLRSKKLEPKIIKEAASEIIHGIDVNENIHASKEFRSHIARVYANRAIQAASKGL